MKRLIYGSLAFGLLLGFCAASNAQSCYSGSYGQAAYAEPFALSAQTQTIEVPVRVTVTVPQVQVAAPIAAPVAVTAPSCGAMAYSAQQAVGVPYAVPFAVAAPAYGASCGVGFSAGFSYGHNVGFNRSLGVINRGFVGQQFGAGLVGGTGITLQARDRRGNQVIANGVNNVRIQRGLLGRINGATADSNRGLLGRVSPF